nr:hypothetical protein [Nocardia neocaledoniensis]
MDEGHRARAEHDHPAPDQSVERVGHGLLGQSGRGAEQLEVGRHTTHGDRLGDGPLGLGQLRQLRADRPVDRRVVVGGRVRVLPAQGALEFGIGQRGQQRQIQRIAVRGAEQPGPARPRLLGQQPVDVGLGERRNPQVGRTDPRRPQQPREHGRTTTVPVGKQQPEPTPGPIADQEGQYPQRFGVGPLHVVDDEQRLRCPEPGPQCPRGFHIGEHLRTGRCLPSTRKLRLPVSAGRRREASADRNLGPGVPQLSSCHRAHLAFADIEQGIGPAASGDTSRNSDRMTV